MSTRAWVKLLGVIIVLQLIVIGILGYQFLARGGYDALLAKKQKTVAEEPDPSAFDLFDASTAPGASADPISMMSSFFGDMGEDMKRLEEEAANNPADKAVAELEVPPSDDTEAMRAYLDQVSNLAADRNHFSSRDTFAEAFEQIGREALPLLGDYRGTKISWYLPAVVNREAQREDKEVVLDWFHHTASVARTVQQFEWESDCVDSIRRYMHKKDVFNSFDWEKERLFEMAVAAGDSALYPDLEEMYFAYREDDDDEVMYSTLIGLDDFPLHTLHDRIWRHDGDPRIHNYETSQLAERCVRYGSVLALSAVAKAVLEPVASEDLAGILARLRDAIDKNVPGEDDPVVKAQRVLNNPTQIRFDPASKEFTLAGTANADPSEKKGLPSS